MAGWESQWGSGVEGGVSGRLGGEGCRGDKIDRVGEARGVPEGGGAGAG